MKKVNSGSIISLRYAILTAIAASCVCSQYANAEDNSKATAVTFSSPFYPVPFQTIKGKSTEPKYDDKPHVMLSLDDSDSMMTEVFPKGGKPILCKNSYVVVDANRADADFFNIERFDLLAAYTSPIEEGCKKIVKEENGSLYILHDESKTRIASARDVIPDYRNNWKYYQKYYYFKGGINASVKVIYPYYSTQQSLGTRAEIMKNSLKKVLPVYNDKIRVNMLTYWGSEAPEKKGCPYYQYSNEYYPANIYPYKSNIAVYQSPNDRINTVTGKYGSISFQDYRRTDTQVGYSVIPSGASFSRITQDQIKPSKPNPFFKPNEILSLINAISIPSTVKITDKDGTTKPKDCMGSTPSTIRYIQAAKILQDTEDKNAKNKKQCQTNHLIVFSDGDPREQLKKNAGAVVGLTSIGTPRVDTDYEKFNLGIYPSLPSGYDFAGTGDNQGIAFFSKKLFETDKLPGAGNAQTYTIGFGDSISESGRTYLIRAAAIKDENGKLSTEYTDKNGKLQKKGYWDALTPEDLEQAFKEIFENITASSVRNPENTGSTASPGHVSSSETGLAATLTLNTGIWGSLLKFHQLDDNGNPVKENGKIVSKDADYNSDRHFLMNNGSNVYWLDNGKVEGSAKSDFGFANEKEFIEAFLPWLRRDSGVSDVQIEKRMAGITDRKVESYRNRLAILNIDGKDTTPEAIEREMGDVLNTPIVGINDDKHRYVLTGANDGMVYIFQNEEGEKAKTHPYKLVLNYLPGGIVRETAEDTLAQNLFRIASSDYAQSSANEHIYGVNGDIAYVKTAKTAAKENNKEVERQQKVVALGTMGQGGRGVYALNISGCERDSADCVATGLDVSNKNNWRTSVPLWQSTASIKKDARDDNSSTSIKLGYTYSKPVMYQVATKWTNGKPDTSEGVRVAGFVANGFRAGNDNLQHEATPTLYVYDVLGEEVGSSQRVGSNSSLGNAAAGKLIGKISVRDADTDTSHPLLNNSGIGVLSSPAVIDADRDGIADIAYAGDYAGNLYRFDLRGEPNHWKAVKVYDGDPTQPITAAPSVYHYDDSKYIVVFGTGSDLFKNDLTDISNIQGFFGIYDDIKEVSPNAIKRSELIERKFTETGNKRKMDDSSKIIKKGWWFALNKGKIEGTTDIKTYTSEKMVTKPTILLDTVFFTTRIYTYTEKGKTNIGTKQCPIERSEKTSDGESWLMAIDVKTGDNIKANNEKAVRFLSNDAKDSSGINLGKLASRSVLSSPSAVGEMPASLGKTSNEVGDGELTDLNKGGGEAKKCLDSNDYFIMMSLADKDNPLRNEQVTGPVCPNPGLLIRLNLREITQ